MDTPVPAARHDIARTFAVGCALLAFAVYALIASPGLYWLDSGELASAAVTLGIGHPTGFPLVMLWDKAFALLPLGELAFRTALASAAATALAVSGVARLADQLAGRGATGAVASVLAPCVFGASLTTFRQATVTEVYALTALAIVTTIRLAVAWARRPPEHRSRLLLALCLISGLSLGVHASHRLLVLPPVLLLVIQGLRRGARASLLALLFLGIGAGVLLYLPVRAAHAAYADWGDPRTLGRLVDHLAASRIRHAFASEMLSRVPAVVRTNAAAFARIELRQLGPLALALAVLGVGALIREGLAGRVAAAGVGALFLATLVVGDVVYSVWVNPMGIADLQCGEPLAVGVAVLAAVGAAVAAKRFARAAPYVAGVLVCVVSIEPILSDGATKVRGTTPAARRWAEAVLEQSGPRALLLVTTDTTAAGLMYLQGACGERPDVLTVVRQQAWDSTALATAFARAGGGPQSHAGFARFSALPETVRIERTQDEVVALVKDALARGEPVLAEPGPDLPVGANLLDPSAPLWRVSAPAAAVEPIASVARRFAALLDVPADPPAAELLSYELINLGAWASRAGDLPTARRIVELARVIAPDDEAATVAAARYALAEGDDASAGARLREALDRAPVSAEALALRGTLEARQGDYRGALLDLCRALALDPANQDARVNLALLATRLGGQASCPAP